MPKRIQRRRTKGWRMPEGAVYVGRPSKWGNPFPGNGDRSELVITEAVESYRWCLTEAQLSDYSTYARGMTNEKLLRELRGRDLACWCALDKPCHADVLLELANQ